MVKFLYLLVLSLCLASVASSSINPRTNDVGNANRQLEDEIPKQKPKPHPSTSDSGTTGTEGSTSETNDSESESSGLDTDDLSNADESSGGSSGGGGSSSGGSSSGGSSGGGGSSSGGSSSGESSSGGSTGSGSASSGAGSKSVTHHATETTLKAHAGVLGLAAAAMLAGALLATAATSRRKIVLEEPKHALNGSVNRRMEMFSHLAKHSNGALRPPRRVSSMEDVSEGSSYELHPDTKTAVNV